MNGHTDPPDSEDLSSDIEDEWRSSQVFTDRRHTEDIKAPDIAEEKWRMKERVSFSKDLLLLNLTVFVVHLKMKTVSVALVLCLNVGVDPPDIIKTQPCAKYEAWIEPLSMAPQKALENIGANL